MMSSEPMNGCNEPEIIDVKEKDCTIYFNSAITANSMSKLVLSLHRLEDKILNQNKRLKRKVKELYKNNNKNDKNDKYNSDDEDDYDRIKIEPKEIKLYITSYGGYLYQVYTAIDFIKNLKVPVHTICTGIVASAGTLLSLSGSRRSITKNSYMLIHELRGGSWGKFSGLSDSFQNQQQLMDHIINYYVENTKITREELEEQLKKDITWNADICLEKGLVNEII
jgi:hypothetical protein